MSDNTVTNDRKKIPLRKRQYYSKITEKIPSLIVEIFRHCSEPPMIRKHLHAHTPMVHHFDARQRINCLGVRLLSPTFMIDTRKYARRVSWYLPGRAILASVSRIRKQDLISSAFFIRWAIKEGAIFLKEEKYT